MSISDNGLLGGKTLYIVAGTFIGVIFMLIGVIAYSLSRAPKKSAKLDELMEYMKKIKRQGRKTKAKKKKGRKDAIEKQANAEEMAREEEKGKETPREKEKPIILVNRGGHAETGKARSFSFFDVFSHSPD